MALLSVSACVGETVGRVIISGHEVCYIKEFGIEIRISGMAFRVVNWNEGMISN